MIAKALCDRIGIIGVFSCIISKLTILITILCIRIISVLREILLCIVKEILLIKCINLLQVITALQATKCLHGCHHFAHTCYLLIRKSQFHQIKEVVCLTVPDGSSRFVHIMCFYTIFFVRQSPVGSIKAGISIIYTPSPLRCFRSKTVRIRILCTLIRTCIKFYIIHKEQRILHIPIQRNFFPELSNTGIDKKHIQFIARFVFQIGSPQSIPFIHKLRDKIYRAITYIGRNKFIL